MHKNSPKSTIKYTRPELLQEFQQEGLQGLENEENILFDLIGKFPDSFVKGSQKPENNQENSQESAGILQRAATNGNELFYENKNDFSKMNIASTGSSNTSSPQRKIQSEKQRKDSKYSPAKGQRDEHLQGQEKLKEQQQLHHVDFSIEKQLQPSKDRQSQSSSPKLQQYSPNQSILPFSQSGMMKSVGLEERGWYYIDETDQIQGPFTCLEMDNWFVKGFFSDELQVGFKSAKNRRLYFKLSTLLIQPAASINKEVTEFLRTEQTSYHTRSHSQPIRSTRRPSDLSFSPPSDQMKYAYKSRRSLIYLNPSRTSTPKESEIEEHMLDRKSHSIQELDNTSPQEQQEQEVEQENQEGTFDFVQWRENHKSLSWNRYHTGTTRFGGLFEKEWLQCSVKQ